MHPKVLDTEQGVQLPPQPSSCVGSLYYIKRNEATRGKGVVKIPSRCQRLGSEPGLMGGETSVQGTS